MPAVQLAELLEEASYLHPQPAGDPHPLHITFFDDQGGAVLLLLFLGAREDLDARPLLLRRDEDLRPGERIEGRDEGELELPRDEVVGVRVFALDRNVDVTRNADLRVQCLERARPADELLVAHRLRRRVGLRATRCGPGGSAEPGEGVLLFGRFRLTPLEEQSDAVELGPELGPELGDLRP